MNSRRIGSCLVPALLIAAACAAPTIADLNDGLVLYLSFDEGSGIVAHDGSANHNDAAVYNTAWVNGPCGNALRFDGSTSYASANTINVDYLSVALWVKNDSFYQDSGGHPPVSNADDGLPWSGFVLEQGTMAPYERCSFVVGTTDTIAGVNTYLLRVGQWYYLTFTYDGQVLKCYVNGRFLTQTACSGAIRPAMNPFLLGRPYFPSNWPTFNGALDEVRIYDRALRAEEVQQLYQDCRLLGDLTCNGLVNGLDIDPFIVVLFGTAPDYPEYYAEYPNCDHMLADMNGDGAVNGQDIDGFVCTLFGDCP